MHHINLVLAIVWLVVGVGLAIWAAQGAEGSKTMIIVVCGVLALYNLARWFTAGTRVAPTQEKRRGRHRSEDNDEPVDPNFDFSDGKPD